jgi:hypothetical protein
VEPRDFSAERTYAALMDPPSSRCRWPGSISPPVARSTPTTCSAPRWQAFRRRRSFRRSPRRRRCSRRSRICEGLGSAFRMTAIPPLQTFNTGATSLGFQPISLEDVSARKVALDGRCVSRGAPEGRLAQTQYRQLTPPAFGSAARRRPRDSVPRQRVADRSLIMSGLGFRESQ